jgi:hypothetical protein
MPPGSVDAFVITYIASLREGELEWCECADLVKSAREDEAHFDMLREFTAKLIEVGAPLSGTLRGFVAGFLRNPMKVKRRPGPSRLDFRYRDLVIQDAVWHIRDTWKFPATRHPDEARCTAASIVSKALAKGANINIGEAAVNKIWNAGAAGRKRRGGMSAQKLMQKLVEMETQEALVGKDAVE